MSNGENKKRSNCLICGAQITSSSYSVFCTIVPHTNTLLASALEKIICKRIVNSSLPTAFICAKCFSLFEELGSAENKCVSIKKTIVDYFQKNSYRSNNDLEDIVGVACQTENLTGGNTTEIVTGVKCEEDTPTCENNKFCDEQASEPKTDTESCKASSLVSGVAAKTLRRTAGSNKRKGRPTRKSNNLKQISKLQNSQEKDIHRVGRYIHPCSLCGRLFRRPCEVKQHLLSHGGAKPYQCRDCGKRFGSKSGAGIHALKKHGKDITADQVINLCNDNSGTNPTSKIIEKMVELDNTPKKETIQYGDNSESSSEDDFEWKMDEQEMFGALDVEEEKLDQLSDSQEKAVSVAVEPSGNIGAKKEENQNSNTETKSSEGDTQTVPNLNNSPSKHSINVPIGSSDDKIDKTKNEKKRKREPQRKEPKHECSTCGKKWRTMSEFKSHVATHSDERPYICEICGQAYKHKQALDIHVGMHNGINPFCCPYCNKAFTQKGALQRHMPIHTGEAPFQCELCGKRFLHHTSFNMHTLAHTGQKSYKCSLCGLALLSGSHLKRHSRVHTGERPYQCQTCGKRFAERYNLVAHTRVHDAGSASGARETNNKKHHRCQLCGARFDRRPKLDHHMALCHSKVEVASDGHKWIGHIVDEDSNKHVTNVLGSNVPVNHTQIHSETSSQNQRPLLLHTVPGHVHVAEQHRGHTNPHDTKITTAQSHAHPHTHPLLAAAAAAQQTLSAPNQHQQNWHQIIFGGNSVLKPEDGTVNLVDGAPQMKVGTQNAGMNQTSQHRLLAEMPSLGHTNQSNGLGAGVGAGRSMLASCLAAAAPHHLVPNSHVPHLANHHTVLHPRVSMFTSDNS